MRKEDIIKLARVAGCHDNGEEFRFVELHYLERFAALVAAAEREACAKVCDEQAAILFDRDDTPGGDIAVSLRDAIRARGQA